MEFICIHFIKVKVYYKSEKYWLGWILLFCRKDLLISTITHVEDVSGTHTPFWTTGNLADLSLFPPISISRRSLCCISLEWEPRHSRKLAECVPHKHTWKHLQCISHGVQFCNPISYKPSSSTPGNQVFYQNCGDKRTATSQSQDLRTVSLSFSWPSELYRVFPSRTHEDICQLY